MKKQSGDGLSTSVIYDFGGSDLAMSGTYISSDRTNQQNLQTCGTGDKAEAWAIGLEYDANDIYITTFCLGARSMTPIPSGSANEAQNFEAVVQYQFDFSLCLSLSHVFSKGKDIEGVGNEDLVDYIDVDAAYYLNKNMSALISYKINQLDSDNRLGINGDDIVAVGMVYWF